MRDLLGDGRSTAMSNNNPSSSSTLSFLGLIKQLESDPFRQTQTHDPLELQESDVFWSFAASPDSYSHPNPTSPLLPSHHHHRRFNHVKSGPSDSLSDDHHHLICRKSIANQKVISRAARQEDIPARFPHSAPMNVPVWPKERHKNGDLSRVDEMEDDDGVNGEEEMVPPHVIVARTHVTFSVFEGAGRTLKGRDLRRVRNAVFQKIGFID